MADPTGQQPPGGSMGHPSNLRSGAPGQYLHHGQPQHMMRPQVQQYINRPSPSYQVLFGTINYFKIFTIFIVF